MLLRVLLIEWRMNSDRFGGLSLEARADYENTVVNKKYASKSQAVYNQISRSLARTSEHDF